MNFARSGESAVEGPPTPTPTPTATAAGPSGETQAYCEWAEREVAPCPDDRRYVQSHASLDYDDEDAAWTALLAHARALAFEMRGADQWHALLADMPD